MLRQCGSYAIFCAYPIALLPISGVWLDAFCVLNLLVSLVIVYAVTRHPEAAKVWVAPAVEISAFYRLTLYAPIARLILDDAAALDDWIIRPLSPVIAQSHLPGLVLVAGSLLLGQLFFLARLITSVSETAARFALDVLPTRTREVEAAVHATELQQFEADVLMTKLHRDADFFGRLDGLMRHLMHEMKIGLVIALAIITIDVLSKSLMREEPLGVAILHSGSLGVVANLIACVPIAVISSALKFVTRTDDLHRRTDYRHDRIAGHRKARGRCFRFLAR